MGKLRYTKAGRPTQPPVLFLHGFMGSASDWSATFEVLSRDFYCIAVDLPGHGASRGLSTPEAYSIEGAADILAQLLDGLGIDRCAVVGYSMGGRLALYFALHYPERCSRLVLESASPGLATADERRARQQLDEARARRLTSEPLATFLADWYRQPVFASVGRSPARLDALIEKRLDNDPAELARILTGMSTGRQPSLWERLGDLKVSTLVLAGALDGKYAEIAEAMKVRNDAVHTAVLPNAGHNLHLERPEAYADVVRNFLHQPI